MLGDNLIFQPRAPRSSRIAVGASVLTHVAMGLLAIWVSTLPRSFVSPQQPPTTPRYDLVWIASPGPGGGGGGGGDRTKVAAPAREVGRDRRTVPAPPVDPRPAETPKEPPPTEPIAIAAKPLAAAIDSLPGVIEAAPLTAPTQGAGSGGGGGTGTGTGSGEGTGSGLGAGFGGGTGGGAYRPGSGVTSPQLVREVKPNYTADAMRAKVQGVVLLECVVLPDGTVGDIRIIKSLDKVFGLDDEAIKAARQWQFLPGRRLGEPVSVLVTMELGFTLR